MYYKQMNLTKVFFLFLLRSGNSLFPIMKDISVGMSAEWIKRSDGFERRVLVQRFVPAVV